MKSVDQYSSMPYQLELPLEGKFEGCPKCNPSNDKNVDFWRSMCARHWTEYQASFDEESFRRDVNAIMEESRSKLETCYLGNGFIPSSLPYCGT